MNELENKGVILVIGIMIAVAIAGFVLVLFLNKDYQAALAEKPAELQSQQIQNPYVSAQENQKPARKKESTIDACVDFDNGKDYYVKGDAVWREAKGSDFCEVYNEPGGWTQVNSCLAGDRRCSVAEKYCDNSAPNNIGQEDRYCEYGCDDGACITQTHDGTCTDSDGGINPYIKGKAAGAPYGYGSQIGVIWGEDSNKCSAKFDSNLGYSIHYDCCSDSESNKQLNEAYCKDGLVLAEGIQCEFGCQNGAC